MAIISPCDDTASNLCHQLGHDHGVESFSGFEFRHMIQSDLEVRCHMLHERCSASAVDWAANAEHIVKLVSHFFDLDSSACPVILICISRLHSNERLLSHHILPMIRDRFPAVASIAIQSETFSSKPAECLSTVPLVQCVSYAGQSIPSSVVPLLANLFHVCACSRHKRTPLPAEPHIFVGTARDSSPPRVQSFSVPVSPVAHVNVVQPTIVTARSHLSTSSSSPHALVPLPADEALPIAASPLAADTASAASLGLSLKWGSDGLTVHSVAADSLAGRSGCFKEGDLILNVDGIDVASSRASRHEAVARLRQACDTPVQVCARAGPGWQGHSRRQVGSMILFQLSSSPASPQPPSLISAHDRGVAAEGGWDDDPGAMFDRAKQCYLSGNSSAASTYLLSAARRNHPPACALLASFYLNGSGGLPQNSHLAFSLARWSSLQKDFDGMGILACCFLFELGTKQDLGLAYTFAVGSADASPHGQFCLGYRYSYGAGVTKDAALAER